VKRIPGQCVYVKLFSYVWLHYTKCNVFGQLTELGSTQMRRKMVHCTYGTTNTVFGEHLPVSILRINLYKSIQTVSTSAS